MAPRLAVAGPRTAALGLVLAGMLLAWCPCAEALDPALDVSQYAHTAWKIREGFIEGEILAIAQTPDGYLWLGTELGLLRFDGVRAVSWRPPSGEQLPSNYVGRLLVARDGTLWIGTLKGLASWKDGKLTLYPNFTEQVVFTLLEDNEGMIWVGTQGISGGRLCAIRNGNVQQYGEDGSFGAWVGFLLEDRRKNIWALTASGLWRWRPGPPKLYPMASPNNAHNNLIQDDEGTLLINTESGIKQFVNGRIEADSLPGVGPQLKTRMLFGSSSGALWIVTDRGLVHVHRGRTDMYGQSDGLSGDYINALFEDREGDIWVATNGGLDRFRDYAVATLSVKQGLSNTTVASVLADRDGSVWLTNGALQRWNNGRILTYGKRDPDLNGRSPHSLFQDGRGRIWVCTLDKVGYLENDRFVSVGGIPGGAVRAISEDASGNLWISKLNAGLFRLSARGEVQQTPWTKLRRKDFATALAVDPLQGGLWLGFYEGGIAYFRDGEVRTSYSVADGLAEGAVSRFRFDPDGTLWAATQGGLSRLKNGRVATLTSRNGLPCDAVHWVIRDNDQSFWLEMPCGLGRITRMEVDTWAAAVDKDKDTKRTIQATVFDNSDGVRIRGYPGGDNSRVTRSPDGKLWFATNDGLSVVDPRNLHFNKVPPPVHIEQLTADRKTYDPASYANGRVALSARIRDLEIDYTALSLAAPEKVRFRYKLEGRDRDWQDAGTRRQAFYNDLPPRNYRFRVMACNNSGVWNEAGASLDFSIAPAYYQTWWFRLSCVAGLLALLWAVYQLRLRQMTAQVRHRLEGRFEERERIARELHDTLLQSFQGFLLYFQSAINLLPGRPSDAKERLERAADQAQQAIAEGRDAVQGLRSSTIETNDLAAALNAVAAELAANQGGQNSPVFCVQEEGASRDLHAILRDDIFRIASEALRNAFLHAQAGRIEVQIHYDERQLRVRIRDDGKGIDPQIVTSKECPGHWGLRGMQERAKLVGGNFELWSKLGSGTEVELTIPASTAYAKSTQRRSWLSRKRTAVKS